MRREMGWLLCLCFFFSLSLPHVTYSSSSFSFNSSFTQPCSRKQALALLQFKNTLSTNHSASALCEYYDVISYPKTKSWKENTDCCTWDGVTCDRITGHVIGLDLSCSWLYGTFHSNSSLFSLHNLKKLNLAFNNFNPSHISFEFRQLWRLMHLNLSQSGISGEVPSEIAQLSHLVTLDLSNQLLRISNHNLKMMVLNFTRLRALHLDEVSMSFVEPTSLTNLSSSLMSLTLFECQLHGQLPENIFRLPNLQVLGLGSFNSLLKTHFPRINWSSPLQELDLFRVSILGGVLDSISHLKSLNYLILLECDISEPVSMWLVNLPHINHLDLSYNNLSGEIPSLLSNLKQLRYLRLSSNNLIGQIPSALYRLPSLQVIHLDSNKLTGNIGEFQYNKLLEISLSYNNLHGVIPKSIFDQVNLTYLHLSSNNLSGRIDLQELSNLKSLQSLSLSNNSLSMATTDTLNLSFPMLRNIDLSSCNITKFPDFLKNQEKLDLLDLSNNKLEGLTPKWLFNVGRQTLFTLDLSHNFLEGFDQSQGFLPWTTLEFLDLHSNLLQGSLPLPHLSIAFYSVANNRLSGPVPRMICNMTDLQVFDLSNNSFSGQIPSCLGNIHSNLLVLYLQRNHFHGPIPNTFLSESQLSTLDLSHNKLQGPLPRSLAYCKNLEVLNLENNALDDTFPFWLGTLPKLKVVALRSNRFHGPLRWHRKRLAFTELQIIDLSHNDFTGSLPSEFFKSMKAMMIVDNNGSYLQSKYYGNYYYRVTIVNKGNYMEMERILTTFKAIDFSNNKFEGEIPESIGNLSSLHVLNLSSNGFRGSIPSTLGNLGELESLDLSNNKLSGEIPSQLAELRFLSTFDVSKNQLEGPIPRGEQFQTFSNTSYEGNSGLCGFPLSKNCNSGGNKAPSSAPGSTSEQGHKSKLGMDIYDWIVVVMGVGCGLVIGVVGGNYLTQRKEA